MKSPCNTEPLTYATQFAGDLEDFDKVIATHWMHIYRFSLNVVHDHDAAQSIAQDCFLRAYRARSSFRGEASVSTWLLRIAVNLIRDRERSRALQFWRRAAQSAVEPNAVETWLAQREPDPEERALLRERMEAIWEGTRMLTRRQREVFLLRFVEELDLAEIATVTGLTLSSVKTHLHRAVASLRKRIGEKHAPLE